MFVCTHTNPYMCVVVVLYACLCELKFGQDLSLAKKEEKETRELKRKVGKWRERNI